MNDINDTEKVNSIADGNDNDYKLHNELVVLLIEQLNHDILSQIKEL